MQSSISFNLALKSDNVRLFPEKFHSKIALLSKECEKINKNFDFLVKKNWAFYARIDLIINGYSKGFPAFPQSVLGTSFMITVTASGPTLHPSQMASVTSFMIFALVLLSLPSNILI